MTDADCILALIESSKVVSCPGSKIDYEKRLRVSSEFATQQIRHRDLAGLFKSEKKEPFGD